jgi:hypothetical protein
MPRFSWCENDKTGSRIPKTYFRRLPAADKIESAGILKAERIPIPYIIEDMDKKIGTLKGLLRSADGSPAREPTHSEYEGSLVLIQAQRLRASFSGGNGDWNNKSDPRREILVDTLLMLDAAIRAFGQ